MKMKSRLLIILTVALILSSLTMAFAGETDNDLNLWLYEKDVQCSESKGYQAFFLDEDVYRLTKRDLSDLRIVDDQGDFIPYYLHNQYLTAEKVTIVDHESTKLASYLKKDDHYTEFRIIQKDELEDILANEIIFDISGDNFLEEVMIYGSYDNNNWQHVKDGYIYNTDEGNKLNIKLDGTFKFDHYRIVFVNDVEKTEINNLELVYSEKNVVHEQYQKMKSVDYSLDYSDGYTEIILENKDNLKVKSLKIVSGDSFKRSYQLSYKNEGEENYRSLDSGEVYQMDLENFKIEETEISCGRSSDSYISADFIKIRISDKDDKAIDINEIEVTYYIDKLVFENQASSGYTLLFGSDTAKQPSYDIVQSKKYIEEEDQQTCSLSQLVEREVKVAEEPFDYRIILNVIVVLVSIILVAIIMRKSGFKKL